MNTKDLSFCIADFPCRIIFDKGIDDGRIYLPSYAPFYIKEAESKYIFTLHVSDGMVSADSEGEEVGQFDAGGNNHGVYHMPDGGYKFIISSVRGNIACAMRVNKDFSESRVTLFGNEADKRFGLNNCIMITFAFSSSRHKCLLMHSSVIMSEGCGYLFLGKSGTGKSTHSDLWVANIPGSEILNDDNPAVRVMGNGIVRVYGTPWSGKRDYYRNIGLPVGAFVQLEQAPENHIRKESKLTGFATILSSTSSMIWDKESYRLITETVSQIATSTPVYHLKNRPEPAAAYMSHDAVKKQ